MVDAVIAGPRVLLLDLDATTKLWRIGRAVVPERVDLRAFPALAW
jgi:hypothetical protein